VTYKLVIFDFDGTLGDSLPWFRLVVNGVADKFRFRPVHEHETETLRGMSASELMAHLKIPKWKLPMIAAHVHRLMQRDIHQVPLFEGVDRMLHALSRAGMALAVVSSNSESNIRRVLGPCAALFGHYACGAAIFGKHERFRTVVRQSGVRPCDVICIGDEIRDYEAATREGLSFGAVTWGYTRPDTLAALSPKFMFTSVNEVLDKLAPDALVPRNEDVSCDCDGP
jgi:phosphoglycolate phosphatase